MKKGILFLLVITTVTANAQSLKDLLYGGKLKKDSSTVIRKGDDLSSKIDTSQKKPVEPEKIKPAVVTTDSSPNKTAASTDSPAAVTDKVDLNTPPKDNNKIWKEFTDSVISTLKQEVMNSKKIKKGDYFVIVDYEIGLDGKVTITNVMPTPENKYISEQVKERLSIDTPQLNPVLGGNGKPRKVVKRTNFTITKE
jgi:hypothetical protein